MKKIIFRILSSLLITLVIVSCSTSGEELKYQPETERGWVQFVGSSVPSSVPSSVLLFEFRAIATLRSVLGRRARHGSDILLELF